MRDHHAKPVRRPGAVAAVAAVAATVLVALGPPAVGVAWASAASSTTASPVPVTVSVTPSVPSAAGGPPPGALHLLAAVSADENQLISLSSIGEARSYLQRAQAQRARAEAKLSEVEARWETARLSEVRAVAGEVLTLGRVNFYEEALDQLGLAEYTGSSSANSGVVSQESQLDQAELASVVATTATASLDRLRHELKEAKQLVVANGLRADRAWGVVLGARAVARAAQSQVTLSRQDVALAHKWALQPGAAPVWPSRALLRLEGPLGKAVEHQAQHQPHVEAAQTSPSTGPPTGTSVPEGASTTIPAATTVSSSTEPTAPGRPPAFEGPSILGSSLLSAAQIEGWFVSTGDVANATVPVGRLVADYVKAGRQTGVKADIAFAQSVVETGYFDFPKHGQLTGKDNNFAGIGACDSCKHGWKFPSAMAGVVAQERLLEAYATPAGWGPSGSLASLGIEGCCSTWLALSGVWATNPDYGYEILAIYKEMLDWAIPRQLAADGLLSPAQLVIAEAAAAREPVIHVEMPTTTTTTTTRTKRTKRTTVPSARPNTTRPNTTRPNTAGPGPTPAH